MKRIIYSSILTFIFLPAVSFAQLPDLTVPSGGFTPSSIARGGQLTITATVKNDGTANSSRSHLYFYLSPTTTISNGDLVGCLSVEPLAVGASSEPKQLVISVPTTLPAGNYYVGWVVDPFNEVAESNENNGFYLQNSELTITSSIIFGRHIPYPIILIHGLHSSDQTWDSLASQLGQFGWSFGGRMDYCLNYDDNLSTSILANDIHDFTTQSALNIGDFYTINFDVNPNGIPYNDTVESNQAAIVKQGKALQSAIKHVLDKTGANKVILVAHSMGGLAAREYLQNPSDWQSDGRHHVAKLLTIGTPHGGSDEWTLGGIAGIDGYSEAVRDLRWSYSNGDAGVYLFGGNENNLASLGFHNTDVNCNGSIGDSIVGLNQKDLPSDLAYACVIGVWSLSGTGDGLVNASRQNLNNYYNIGADTFQVSSFHTAEPEQIPVIIQGLDEPTYFNQAYRVGMDTSYYGLITVQSLANSFTDDYDDYTFTLSGSSQVNVEVEDIAVPQLSIAVFDSGFVRKFIAYSNSMSQIDTTVILGVGKYYFEIEAQPASYSWMFPYLFKLHATPVTAVQNPSTQIPDGYSLLQNYPNPFNPATIISFAIPSRVFVSLKIYDVLGREVADLIDKEMAAGIHRVYWNASGMPSGTYFYRLNAGTFSQTKKLLLLR